MIHLQIGSIEMVQLSTLIISDNVHDFLINSIHFTQCGQILIIMSFNIHLCKQFIFTPSVYTLGGSGSLYELIR